MPRLWGIVLVTLGTVALLSGCAQLVRFEPGAVQGVVVTAGDLPLAGATVYVEGRADLADTTGPDGMFRIEGIAAGPARIVVEHPSVRTTYTSVIVPPGRPVQLPLIAGVDFFDGFENGLGNWAKMGGQDPVLSTDKVFTGRYSMQTDVHVWMRYTFPEPRSAGTVTIWFYDDMDENNIQIAEIRGTRANGSYLIGVASHVNKLSGYNYNFPNNYLTRNNVDSAWADTGIPRTEGWHKITFVMTDEGTGPNGTGTLRMYLDDVEVFFHPHGGKFTMLTIGNAWSNRGGGKGWWDHFTFLAE